MHASKPIIEVLAVFYDTREVINESDLSSSGGLIEYLQS
jgi:hypothetical protein